MGREIRRVAKGWEHPSERIDNAYDMVQHAKYHKPGEFGYGLKFHPLFDNDIETKAAEWLDGLRLWERGEHPSQIKWPEHHPERDYASYAEYAGRSPDPEYYRAEKWTPEQANCYQIYETVSEGTPVSPVFETLEDMRVWLIGQGYSEAAAAGFVKSGWVPSGMFSPQTGFVSGIEIAGLQKDEPAN
jgi:hypothetical protein